jgi:hypothetical protein
MLAKVPRSVAWKARQRRGSGAGALAMWPMMAADMDSGGRLSARHAAMT